MLNKYQQTMGRLEVAADNFMRRKLNARKMVKEMRRASRDGLCWRQILRIVKKARENK